MVCFRRLSGAAAVILLVAASLGLAQAPPLPPPSASPGAPDPAPPVAPAPTAVNTQVNTTPPPASAIPVEVPAASSIPSSPGGSLPTEATTSTPIPTPTDYVLSYGDRISISLMSNPPVSTEKEGIVIPTDGKISFYTVHNIQAAGRTRAEFEKALEEGLKRYIKAPQVAVNLLYSISSIININGSVVKPGQYSLRPGMTFFELLSLAGGTRESAAKEALIYRRDAEGRPTFIHVDLLKLLAGDVSQDVPLQWGDQVVVNEALVYVSGEAIRPGIFTLRSNDTIGKALVASGGVTLGADLEHAFITRNGQIIPLDLRPIKKGVEGVPVSSVPLLSGDTLTIPSLQKRVAVIGDVTQGPIYLIPNVLDKALDIITRAGATTRTADLSKIILIRYVNGNQEVRTTLDLSANGSASDNVILQDGDVLYLPSKREKNRQEGLTQAALITQLLSSLRHF